ncbi:MAG TPA: hypothetical protein VHT03_09910 [Rhizomicrobium sp.]|jgi:hypothetical protein|nr:hypothetical protein [Rhizomicrobium sp.]
MAFRPNYRQERAQKSRTREAKKEEKLRRREEATAKRKALREGVADPDGDPGANAGDGGPAQDGE